MKLRTLTAAGVAAAALLVPTAANAGGSPSTMVAMPNPTTVGTPVTVSNTANASSTCEGSSAVMVSILDPSATVVDQFEVTPDGNGDWSFGFTPDETGTWEVLAECFAQETAFPNPDFSYNALAIQVQAPGTTTVVPTLKEATSRRASPKRLPPSSPLTMVSSPPITVEVPSLMEVLESVSASP